MEGDPTILTLPVQLDELVAYAFPDALWVAGQQHSPSTYTIWVLDLDYRYNEMRACLSMDNRWTLSPVHHSWHTAETGKQSKLDGEGWNSNSTRAGTDSTRT
jgi:hypothetical protein